MVTNESKTRFLYNIGKSKIMFHLCNTIRKIFKNCTKNKKKRKLVIFTINSFKNKNKKN